MALPKPRNGQPIFAAFRLKRLPSLARQMASQPTMISLAGLLPAKPMASSLSGQELFWLQCWGKSACRAAVSGWDILR